MQEARGQKEMAERDQALLREVLLPPAGFCSQTAGDADDRRADEGGGHSTRPQHHRAPGPFPPPSFLPSPPPRLPPLPLTHPVLARSTGDVPPATAQGTSGQLRRSPVSSSRWCVTEGGRASLTEQQRELEHENVGMRWQADDMAGQLEVMATGAGRKARHERRAALPLVEDFDLSPSRA
eukprot:746087-Hanusia_phi.AAC.14